MIEIAAPLSPPRFHPFIENVWPILVRTGFTPGQKPGRRGELRWPHLNVSHDARRLHSTGHVHSITPDVVVRFPGSNYSCQHSTFIQTYSEVKIIRRERFQHCIIFNCVVYQASSVFVGCSITPLWICLVSNTFCYQTTCFRNKQNTAQRISWVRLNGFFLSDFQLQQLTCNAKPRKLLQQIKAWYVPMRSMKLLNDW